VSVEFANLDTDWKFSDGTRSVRTNSLILKIEERSEIGLTVGAGVGYHWLRLDDQNGSGSTKFDAQNLQLYLRHELALSEAVKLEGALNFAWYTGEDTNADDSADIDWSQVGADLGVNYRFGNLGITPFVSYIDVDGDTSGLDDDDSFEMDESFGQGVRFDIFVESTGFISLELRAGNQTGGYLAFVQRY